MTNPLEGIGSVDMRQQEADSNPSDVKFIKSCCSRIVAQEVENKTLRGRIAELDSSRAHIVVCYRNMEEAKRRLSVERDAVMRADKAGWQRAEQAEAALAGRDADLRGLLADVRAYHIDCSCYACQRRRVIADELDARAEEGSIQGHACPDCGQHLLYGTGHLNCPGRAEKRSE